MNANRRFRSLTLAWLLSAGALSSPGPAAASESLRKNLAEMAREVARFLGKQGEDSLAVGQFTGPSTFPSSAGPGIAMILTEELAKQGITVKLRARLGVRGQYQITEVPDEEDPTARYLAVRLKATLEDAFNNVVGDFRYDRVIPGETPLVEMFGAVVDLPSRAPPKQRDLKIRQSLKEPRTSVDNNRIAASSESPYAMEILVNHQPRAGRDDEGLAFVDLDPKASFAIRLINRSDVEAAVRLSIDGLSLFAFTQERQQQGPRKGEPLYGVVLVKPRESVVVKGWHRTNDQADPFLVQEYARGHTTLQKHRGKLGTITALFSAAWPENAEPPADEPPARRGAGQDTEAGPPDNATTFAAVRRKVGTIRSAVSVRYSR